MEFEGDKPVSEAERHLAESRQVTIQPLHADVTPNELPAEAIVAAHLSTGAVGNVTGDIEQEARPLQPLASTVSSADVAHKPVGRTALTITGLALFVLVIVFIVFQK
jgi:hypothetical protein